MTETLKPIDWIPSPNLYTHAGMLIQHSPNIVFFAAPPAEIGQVQSIGSTLTRGKRPRPAILKICVSAIVFLPLILLVLSGRDLPIIFLLFYFIFSLVISAVIFIALSFRHTCSFVGDQGIAYYTITGSHTLAVTEDKLLFKDVSTLYTRETRQYINGIYTGKNIHCTFNKLQDQHYAISGYNQDKKKQLPSDNTWYFVKAAEQAWTSYYIQYAGQQLGQLGYIEFAMADNPKAVRVGKGYLEFIAKDNSTAHMAATDIKEIALNNGFFCFEHKDSTWWQGQAKCHFAYEHLSNACAFLVCLKQLVGIVFD
jgi:hypothetical protein